MAAADLTSARLRELLRYEPETGGFFWLVSRGLAKAGGLAGAKALNGYTVICVDRKLHFAHRLAFLFQTGIFPAGQVDHIDGDRSNNRWFNLRDVGPLINGQNRSLPRRDSKSGLIGAIWDGHAQCRKKWRSKIRVDGRYVDLGRFLTAQEASAAYLKAKRELHPGWRKFDV